MGTIDPDSRRAEARRLRQAGHSIKSIAESVSASTSSVSTWCRHIELTEAQARALRESARRANRRPRDTQWRRRIEIADLQMEAARSVIQLAESPLWAAGVALYWAEGAKTERRLMMANSDPVLLRLFMRWTRQFHGIEQFRASLNLHAGNDETAAIEFWARELSLERSDFTKTFVKPEGTGHRKNHLTHGVARVSARRSTDAWLRTLVWMRTMSDHL